MRAKIRSGFEQGGNSMFDLHMHSGYSSDGEFTPAQLAELVEKAGLDTAALTDHDTLRGVREFEKECAARNINVIHGIECSTLLGEYGVHVLGYGVDLDDPWLNSLEAKAAKNMDETFSKRVEKLANYYHLTIDEQRIRKLANGKNPWFTLIDEVLKMPEIQDHPDWQDYLPGGQRSDPAPVNFFWDNCQPGSPLYVKAKMPDFTETVHRIHEAGGVVIVAHPFRTFFKNDKNLQIALDAGIDGLEAYSNYHDDDMNAWYEQWAEDHDLLITCGSDFHGEKKPSISLGDYGLHKDGSAWLEQLRKKIAENNAKYSETKAKEE